MAAASLEMIRDAGKDSRAGSFSSDGPRLIRSVLGCPRAASYCAENRLADGVSWSLLKLVLFCCWHRKKGSAGQKKKNTKKTTRLFDAGASNVKDTVQHAARRLMRRMGSISCQLSATVNAEGNYWNALTSEWRKNLSRQSQPVFVCSGASHGKIQPPVHSLSPKPDTSTKLGK